MPTFEEIKTRAVQRCRENVRPLTLHACVGYELELMTTKELTEFYMTALLGGEMSLRSYMEEQIIGAVINAVRYEEGGK